MADLNSLRMETLLIEILQELKKDHSQVLSREWPLTLDAKQAEEFTGIKKGKLYQYAKMKGFPVIRDETNSDSGGRVFFSRDGLTKWVIENEGKILRSY